MLFSRAPRIPTSLSGSKADNPVPKLRFLMSQRKQVVELYKTLLALGKDYPLGYDFFRTRLKKAFLKNRDEKSPERIEEMISRGRYVQKEIETLYMLRKYRTLKRRYNETD